MPDYPTLTLGMWVSVNYLAKTFKSFANILDDAFKKITVTLGHFQEVRPYSILLLFYLQLRLNEIHSGVIFRTST